jgi:hypothetical protein
MTTRRYAGPRLVRFPEEGACEAAWYLKSLWVRRRERVLLARAAAFGAALAQMWNKYLELESQRGELMAAEARRQRHGSKAQPQPVRTEHFRSVDEVMTSEWPEVLFLEDEQGRELEIDLPPAPTFDFVYPLGTRASWSRYILGQIEADDLKELASFPTGRVGHTNACASSDRIIRSAFAVSRRQRRRASPATGSWLRLERNLELLVLKLRNDSHLRAQLDGWRELAVMVAVVRCAASAVGLQMPSPSEAVALAWLVGLGAQDEERSGRRKRVGRTASALNPKDRHERAMVRWKSRLRKLAALELGPPKVDYADL